MDSNQHKTEQPVQENIPSPQINSADIYPNPDEVKAPDNSGAISAQRQPTGGLVRKIVIGLAVVIILAVAAVLADLKIRTKPLPSKNTQSVVSVPRISSSSQAPSSSLQEFDYANSTGQEFKVNFYEGSSIVSNQSLNTAHHDKPNQTLLSPARSDGTPQLWMFIGAAPYFPSEQNAKSFYQTLDNCFTTEFSVNISSLNEETDVCSTPDSYYNGVSYNMPFYSGKAVYQATIGLNSPSVTTSDLAKYDQGLKSILASIVVK